MAIALFKAISAIGRHTTAFLQSLFLFPFHTVMQALHRIPGFRQTTQPTLPYSTSPSVSNTSSSSAFTEVRNDDVGADGRRNESDMAVTSSSSAASGMQTRDATVSKALPQNTIAGKENLPSADDSPTKALSVVTDKFSRLDLDGAGAAAAAPSTSLRDVVNGTGSAGKDGAGKQVVQDAVLQQQSGLDSADGTAAREVPRAPPVPLTHSVSQTSRPKETTTTIQLGTETVQIQPKFETPEQAAERAMHSRFMREALDMVGLGLRGSSMSSANGSYRPDLPSRLMRRPSAVCSSSRGASSHEG
jgi:hypothetical protein